MNWYRVTIERIGDPDGLMVIEVKGKDLEDAKLRLSAVLFVQACVIKNDWEEA